MENKSIDFFDAQFRRQAAAGEFALNPFEQAAEKFVRGRVLDLGCGLGNLSIAAARGGARVTAVDASPAAIERINATAARENLDLKATLANVESYVIAGHYDTVIAIGILMFLRREQALRLLDALKQAVSPGGTAIVNVLTVGTTYMNMFDQDHYYLFGGNELAGHFADWRILLSRSDSFDAPGDTLKAFSTVIAEKAR
jgi:tellurite methyltransferase